MVNNYNITYQTKIINARDNQAMTDSTDTSPDDFRSVKPSAEAVDVKEEVVKEVKSTEPEAVEVLKDIDVSQAWC